VLRLLPPVQIHAWGGLGSQLFAVALAQEFMSFFPKRSLVIVLHTGGVTRRLPEVTELFPHFEYKYEEDFQLKKGGWVKAPNLPRYTLKKFLKTILISTGFLAECNENRSTGSLRPWVFSIRGHYSYREVSANFLRQLDKITLAMSNFDSATSKTECALHYRLGDLLTITEKNPISPSRLASKFKSIKQEIPFSKLTVFSDSPSEVLSRLTPLIQVEINILDLPTSQVIASAVRSEYFIGTSSKVSFWIAAVRSVVYGNRSALPSENFPQYARMIGKQIHCIDLY
jgi:hypothetical protein